MSELRRSRLRRLQLVAIGASCLAAMPVLAIADTRIAIIDTANDTRPFIAELKRAHVAVVGRYLARCYEAKLPAKRLISNGLVATDASEIAQLDAAGIGILSIYQYYNDSAMKFVGRDKAGHPLRGADCMPTPRGRSPQAEARLDADAAVAQAQALGQPKGSAIYFSVDFLLRPGSPAISGMKQYFREVKRILAAGGYRVGAYGSGLAAEILRQDGLASLFWLSASRAYVDTTRVHNSKTWTLFQNTVNNEWFAGSDAHGACVKGMALDTDIQNPGTDAGFWRPGHGIAIDTARSRDVLAARRFTCRGTTILFASPASSAKVTGRHCSNGERVPVPTTIDFAQSVHIGSPVAGRIAVDTDDDGRFEGWASKKDLTPDYFSKPTWIDDGAKRRRAACP